VSRAAMLRTRRGLRTLVVDINARRVLLAKPIYTKGAFRKFRAKWSS
jgi:hypothetical protein